MWPYPWTHVGTPSHPGHMDRVAATMPSQAHAGAAQEAPDIGQWEGQDVPLVRPSSCNVKGGIRSSRRYLPLRAHLDQVPSNYPSETVVQLSSTAHFHYGFPTVEPLSRYSNKLLSSNLKTAIFQPCKRCHTP